MAERITTNHKELLLDGKHLADCIDEESATAIAVLLRCRVMILPDPEQSEIVAKVFGETAAPFRLEVVHG